MTAQVPAQKLNELATRTSTSANDLLLICQSPGTNSVLAVTQSIAAFFAAVPNLTLSNNASTPANSASYTIAKGTIFVDGNYIYVATANNVVKRAALSSF